MIRRWLMACGLVLALAALPAHAQDVRWDALLPGLDVTLWNPGERCYGEVSGLYVLRADPERIRFAVYHYRDEHLGEPLAAPAWLERTEASVIVNAGLFREDYSYLGLLLKDGRSLGSRRHATWRGLFVAEPTAAGLPKARVLDLMEDRFDEKRPAYTEAAQSLMLVDRSKKLRVRPSGKQAHQTIVAEDTAGHILIMKTTEEVGLRVLAECVRNAYPSLRLAMAMDGGSSSDVVMSKTLWPRRSVERDEIPRAPAWLPLIEGQRGGHDPLPAVIGLFPRQ